MEDDDRSRRRREMNSQVDAERSRAEALVVEEEEVGGTSARA